MADGFPTANEMLYTVPQIAAIDATLSIGITWQAASQPGGLKPLDTCLSRSTLSLSVKSTRARKSNMIATKMPYKLD
jgi:hypothetical protein